MVSENNRLEREHKGSRGRPTGSRRTYLKAAGVVSTMGLAGCTGLIGGSGPIKVGMAFPYTGPYGASAERQRDGVELAVQEINDNGGLLERDVETFDRDTELNPDVNSRRVRDLLHEEEVDFLVANLSGGITTQTQALAAEADVPYMAGSRTSPPFHYPSRLGEASYAPGPLNTVAIATPVRAMVEHGIGNTFYAVIADYGFNRPEAWEFIQEYVGEVDGEIRGSAFTPLGNQDFSSEITEAMDSGAEVMLAMVYGLDFANFMQQANDFGLSDEMDILCPVQSVSFLSIADDPSLWEGVYFGMNWNPALAESDDTAREFAEKFDEEFGYYGEDFAGITYTGMKEFERATRESGGLTPEDISSALDGSTFPSYIMEGETRWRACDNQAVNPAYLLTRGKDTDSMGERGDWDMVEVVEHLDSEAFLPECSYYEEQEQQRG